MYIEKCTAINDSTTTTGHCGAPTIDTNRFHTNTTTFVYNIILDTSKRLNIKSLPIYSFNTLRLEDCTMKKSVSFVCCILVGFLTTSGLATSCNQNGQRGLVYVIRMGNTDYYKIGGTTRNVAGRMQELQTGNPLQLSKDGEVAVDDCRLAEKVIQNYAALAQGIQRIWLQSHTTGNRYRTEWFKVENYSNFSDAIQEGLKKAIQMIK